MFCHGDQSWSESAWRTVGVDEDPSHTADALPLVARIHDPDAPAEQGELRSERALLDDVIARGREVDS
jgi:hypothetical protein